MNYMNYTYYMCRMNDMNDKYYMNCMNNIDNMNYMCYTHSMNEGKPLKIRKV